MDEQEQVVETPVETKETVSEGTTSEVEAEVTEAAQAICLSVKASNRELLAPAGSFSYLDNLRIEQE